MNRNFTKIIFLSVILIVVTIVALELDAFARAGGGRSFGGRGSRSYSAPSRSFSTPSPSRQQASPAPVQPAPQQPGGGGFLRNFGGGILGGLVGGMLFRSLGFGGMGGGMGGGIGIFEILLIAGIGYLLYKMVFKKKTPENPFTQYAQGNYQGEPSPSYEKTAPSNREELSVPEGLSHIRQMDNSFDEVRFKDTAMDIFFKIQGAWMNRNLSTAAGLLTEEMKNIIQKDIDAMLREKKINRLENIAVRSVEITEAWQESGQDFITVLFYANLLDYTTDELTGAVTSGSKTEPVKFEEFWTLARPVGNNPWKLSAINQA